MSIKSYYRFAELSIEGRKEERFGKVVEESHNFIDRFPESKYAKEVEQFLSSSQTNLKNIANEPSKTST
jgi:outer membrane protein assembly factor BamD